MAKYNWKELEQEYILGDYKSVSAFLKEKEIPNNGSTRKQTTGWGDKKRQKEDEIKTKTVQKVIEKQSEKDANNIVKIADVANKLLNKINDATDEINKNMDMFGNIHKGIINRADIKKLTASLKDINDILNNTNNKNPDEEGVIIVDDLPKTEKDSKIK